MKPHARLVLMPAALLALAGCSEVESPTGMAAPNPVAARLLLATATSAGTIVAWGSDIDSLVSQAPAENDFIAVTAGAFHATALREDGSLVSWGKNAFEVVTRTPTESDFVAVAAAGQHSTALRENGTLVSWGRDDVNQVSGTPPDNDFVAVAAGLLYGTALRENGSLVSWGLISGTPTDSDFVAIAAGPAHGHGTALRENGTLVSWGNDEFGQVRRTPPGSDFVAVAAGWFHGIALRENGTLVSWGRDDFNQVSATPPGSDFVAVAAGSLYGIALREDGSLVSWGDDSRAVSETPKGNDFVAVAGGQSTSFAIRVAADDELAPVIQITSPADSATYVIGQEVLADYACTDEDGGSGLASCTGSVANDAPLNTAEVGTKTFVVDAADEAGNTATLTHTYTVVYDFHGFLPPVKNDGEFNKAKAGRNIPLKWRLRDANGEPISDLTAVEVTVEDVSCKRGGSHDWKKAGAAGWMRWGTWKNWWPPSWWDRDGRGHGKREGLKHLGHGYYQYNWKTRKDYTGSCKALRLDLGDGVTHTALFYFGR